MFVSAVTACGSSSSATPDAPVEPDAPPSCETGANRCDGASFQTCIAGEFAEVLSCANACDPALGCVLCVPGSATCEGSTSRVCNATGTGYVDETCDPVQGLSCDAGHCTGACTPQALGKSDVGCDFYPTITSNAVLDTFAFAVVVTSASSIAAGVTIEGGGLADPITFVVAPGEAKVQTLPWNALKLCNGSDGFSCLPPATSDDVMLADGSFRLRSTQPVTVSQFNPLDYTDGASTLSSTNDASLLIPAHAWTGTYVVAGYAAWSTPSFPGLMTITASQDHTTVTVTSTASTTGAHPLAAGVPTTVVLDAGDVIELVNLVGDFTGSRISADKPIQVIGGHDCTNVPQDVPYCDHLEESMFPLEALSRSYVVAAPATPSLPNGKVELVRIIATEPGTTLTYDPAQPGAPITIPDGGFVELVGTANAFHVTANHTILVAQYAEGSNASGDGDPALTLAVPTDQYRTSYQFYVPTNYTASYVQITAAAGAITLDGAAVTAFTTVGASGYGVARVQLANTGSGSHVITGTMPFGIQVYGYGDGTSYWYPGGANLAPLP